MSAPRNSTSVSIALGKKKKKDHYDPVWAEAKKRCHLNLEDIRMARELGLSPRTLIKNNPSPAQRWELPVKDWIRELYAKRHPSGTPAPGTSPPPTSSA